MAILNLTSGIVFVKGWNGTVTVSSLTLSGVSRQLTLLDPAGGGTGFRMYHSASTTVAPEWMELRVLFENVARLDYGNTSGGTARPFAIALGGTATWQWGTSGAGKLTIMNGVTAVGWGVPGIYGIGNTVAATNTGTASIATYTVGAADGTFEVSANCLVTTSTTHSFSLDVTYTDEGNNARTMILPVNRLTGTFLADALITNTTGVGVYHTPVITIRAKAATAITIRTSSGGTFTTVVYNARGVIKQVD